ncbi:MAG: ZIP family metal transporter, partial [Aureibaculum sp.]
IPLGNGSNGLLLWAIVIHKIPITLVLYIFLLQSSLPKKVVYIFILSFAFMSPLGLLLSNQITFFNEHHAEVTGVIIGVFLHIATAILFESTQNHQFNIKKFMAVLLGFAVAFASTQFAVVH